MVSPRSTTSRTTSRISPTPIWRDDRRVPQRLADGETLDDLLPEAFATVREAAQRTWASGTTTCRSWAGPPCTSATSPRCAPVRARPWSSTLPAYLNALTGKGVHVVTVNDYLAQPRRRVDGPGPPLPRARRRLILPSMTAGRAAGAVRRRHHLRHQQRVRLRLPARQHGQRPDLVQRGHNYAIVDEVDSILIDEARTPLIISGPADQPTKWYGEFAKRLAEKLSRDVDYEVDEKKRTVGITEEGIERSRTCSASTTSTSRQHAADPVPQQRDQGQGAVPARQGVRRRGRRGADRRRAHRPGAAGPALQRGHAPGDRGQGGGGDQGGEPDAGHHHPAELLPPLRQARRHDRHGHDRGQ
jgi:hypothetical protein